MKVNAMLAILVTDEETQDAKTQLGELSPNSYKLSIFVTFQDTAVLSSEN